jgi:hypothetical protein
MSQFFDHIWCSLYQHQLQGVFQLCQNLKKCESRESAWPIGSTLACGLVGPQFKSWSEQSFVNIRSFVSWILILGMEDCLPPMKDWNE